MDPRKLICGLSHKWSFTQICGLSHKCGPDILILDSELLFSGKVSYSYFLPVLSFPQPSTLDYKKDPRGETPRWLIWLRVLILAQVISQLLMGLGSWDRTPSPAWASLFPSLSLSLSAPPLLMLLALSQKINKQTLRKKKKEGHLGGSVG